MRKKTNIGLNLRDIILAFNTVRYINNAITECVKKKNTKTFEIIRVRYYDCIVQIEPEENTRMR